MKFPFAGGILHHSSRMVVISTIAKWTEAA